MGGEGRAGTAPRVGATTVGATALALAYVPMPRSWIWMQVAIVIFVVAGMVIAITKLA